METALSWHLPAFLRALLPGTVLRVLGLGAALVPVGWSLPAPESLVARLAPGGGLVAKLLGVGYAGVAALGMGTDNMPLYDRKSARLRLIVQLKF